LSESQLQVNIKTEGIDDVSTDEILIVDDSATVIAVATKMLEDRYVVVSAANGLEAWDILQENKAITLVFSDMQMPMMNGLELLLKIRNSEDMRLAKLPVVMVTGKSDTGAGKQAVFDIGATDFIGKPFDALDLISRARAYVNVKASYRKRVTDLVLDERDMLASASSFHSVGCQALEFSRENNISITVVYIEVVNYDEIEKIVGKKNAMSTILTIAKRINDTVREEDISTRLGINKLAVMYNLAGKASIAMVGRMINHLAAIEFEFDGKPLEVDICHGFENSKNHDKDITFSEICMYADSNLQVSYGDEVVQEVAVAQKQSIKLGENIFGEFKSRGQKIGLWFALKSVINGDYDAIPKKYESELAAKMKKYIDHLKNQGNSD